MCQQCTYQQAELTNHNIISSYCDAIIIMAITMSSSSYQHNIAYIMSDGPMAELGNQLMEQMMRTNQLISKTCERRLDRAIIIMSHHHVIIIITIILSSYQHNWYRYTSYMFYKMRTNQLTVWIVIPCHRITSYI